MKKLVIIFVISLISLSQMMAQNITTIEAKSFDISDNLDLDALASIFGEARNLEDFENKLNDPRLQLSNLDLNEDGLVDYLRVIETSEYGIHLVTIQALVARDLFQDVAVISVEKDYRGHTTVQVVGDVYMYGPNYIIQPVYVHPPVIWAWFRGPYYSSWKSPYFWGYYPSYYNHRRACHPHQYHNNVYVHINVHNTYHRTHHRVSTNSVHIQKRNRSNDYGRNNPHRSFAKRNNGAKNRTELNRRRDRTYASTPSRNSRANAYSQRRISNASSSSELQNNRRNTSIREGRDNHVRSTRQVVSNNRTSRDVQSQYKQTSNQQRKGSSTMNASSVQRQDRQASQARYSSRQSTQANRNQSARTQSTVSNSSSSKAKGTISANRQSSQKRITKSNSRSANSRKTTRSNG